MKLYFIFKGNPNPKKHKMYFAIYKLIHSLISYLYIFTCYIKTISHNNKLYLTVSYLPIYSLLLSLTHIFIFTIKSYFDSQPCGKYEKGIRYNPKKND